MQIYAAAQDALANASFIQVVHTTHIIQPAIPSYNRELYHKTTRDVFAPVVQFANI